MKYMLYTMLLTSILFYSCSKSTTPTTPPKTKIQWTFKGITYNGDSATFTGGSAAGAYVSFDDSLLALNINDEVLISFSTANIKNGVYPVIPAIQTLASTNCYLGLLVDNLAYSSTGSSGSVTVTNNGNTSTISFSNVMMLANGSDSAILSGNIVTQP